MAPATAPIGILYVNLGSPAAPTPAAVRAFLDEFLGDPMVVDLNRFLWWIVRKGIVLPLRSPKSAALYERIWTPEGSPLLVHSRRFAAALGEHLGSAYRVEVAMRYGEPSLGHGLRELARAGCTRAVVLTAFPQASRTTTGTIEAEIARQNRDVGLWLAPVPPYHSDRGYVAALAEMVRAAGDPAEADLVLSFHGLPERYIAQGDPYREHCEATARALTEALGLAPDPGRIAYQSRFGREPWLRPDVTEVVPPLVEGGRRVLLCAPSFTTDCLETLEELGLRLAEECAGRAGSLTLVPCLNDHPAWVQAAAGLVRRAAHSSS